MWGPQFWLGTGIYNCKKKKTLIDDVFDFHELKPIFVQGQNKPDLKSSGFVPNFTNEELCLVRRQMFKRVVYETYTRYEMLGPRIQIIIFWGTLTSHDVVNRKIRDSIPREKKYPNKNDAMV